MKIGYASTIACKQGHGDIEICIFGPYGGIKCATELTRDNARELVFNINLALIS